MKFTNVLLKDLNWTLDDIVLIMKHEDRNLDRLPENLKAEILPYIDMDNLKEDEDALLKLRVKTANGMKNVYYLKLQSEPHARVRRAAIRKLEAMLREDQVKKAHVVFATPFCTKGLTSLIKNLEVASYRFDNYLGHGGYKPNEDNDLPEPEEKYELEAELTFIQDTEDNEALITEAQGLGESINLARLLVDQPANAITPEQLAAEAVAAAETFGMEYEIFDAKKIQELGMDAYWSVAKGSDNEPKFIILRWLNNPDSKEKIALVGKGLCYDSGGYAIKTASGMVTMHADMGGSAAVIGAITALAREDAKVNVIAIVAAAENMISGHAMRNGDIIGSLSGKTIEVINTDAEGRLTLADAVTWAQKYEKATRIVDIATLTGACVVALGNEITGVITNDDKLWAGLDEGAKISGDKIWRMPCDEDMAKLNKSTRADIKNSGARGGGMITAGLFVRAFTGGLPWAHLDIAGPAYQSEACEQYAAGATGVGAELLYHMVRKVFA